MDRLTKPRVLVVTPTTPRPSVDRHHVSHILDFLDDTAGDIRSSHYPMHS